MALLDLSLVTTALIKLLEAHISASSAWPFATWGLPSVSARPPDLLTAGSLGVYLYHVAEEAHTKNQAAVGRDSPPVRFTPMGLSLYYQITARGNGLDDVATLQEQTYLSCAIKALHDYPIVDDSTLVPHRLAPPPAPLAPPVAVLQAAELDGRGNRLRITMQPVAYNDASTFWSGSSLVPRLAAYYQVSVVLLEPEKPTSLTGRVFQYGVQTFVGGAPRLDGSENTLDVKVPGLPAQQLTARPAEAPVGGQIAFTGYNLFGDATRLLIQHVRWPDRVEVDAGWGVIATDDRVFATVQQEADGRPIVPGLYSAQVKVVRRRTLPDGTTRDFGVGSNDTPFTISARIDTLTFVGDAGTLTAYAFPTRDPLKPPVPPDAVQLCIGGAMLTNVTPVTVGPTPVLEPGQFWIVDASTLALRLPAGLAAGRPVSLRLFVLGAESPPKWFIP